jgi:hypothetical protein
MSKAKDRFEELVTLAEEMLDDVGGTPREVVEKLLQVSDLLTEAEAIVLKLKVDYDRIGRAMKIDELRELLIGAFVSRMS